MSESSEWFVYLYVTARGNCPVRDYYEGLEKADRARLARYIDLLRELGTGISGPQAKHLEGPLWELRPGRHRIIYFLHTGRCFYLLHAFRKQTNKTPRREIELARQRMNDLLERISR